MKPRPQKPRIIIAQVEGSGTAEEIVSVPLNDPVPSRNPVNRAIEALIQPKVPHYHRSPKSS
jgi:hypothetical protein